MEQGGLAMREEGWKGRDRNADADTYRAAGGRVRGG